MKEQRALTLIMAAFVCVVFLGTNLFESSAWARAGGGGSSGSRGSRSYSAPSMPSSPSSRPYSTPGSGLGTPGSRDFPNPASQPSSGWFSRSPFLQGMAGGLAGGFLGSLLFGGHSYGVPGGGGGYGGGGGIGLFDLILIGLLLYFGFRFYKRYRQRREETASYYGDVISPRADIPYDSPTPHAEPSYGPAQGNASGFSDDLERGIDQIKRIDPSFNEESFRELVQDLFFRIQAGWMNRSLEGIDTLLTGEMTDFFRNEFERMKQQGRTNRLENIAVRKVELAEAWQETGKDYVTVLFTANLLDYTVDDKTGQVVQGDKLNPVKFQEFWTFSRDVGSSRWQLAAINQPGESITRH